MIVHTETMQIRGLRIEIDVILRPEVYGSYSVFAKAFDEHRGILWRTELRDKDGIAAVFPTLAAAVEGAKLILSSPSTEQIG